MTRSTTRALTSSVVGLALAGMAALGMGGGATVTAARTSAHPHIDCSNGTRFLCTEVANSDEVFGHYVGHDEPSLLFYSHTPGSGNQMTYSGQLPVEPSPTNVPGLHKYDFEYYAAFWFGMAMCDTQSYPEQDRSCIPDSDANIVNPAKSPYHPGAAYMELQFYPPGYVQQWNGFSCDPTRWCVALTIDSLSINPVTGQQLNDTCAARTGLEYVNFAYLTHDGKPQGPPNPVDFTPAASGNPNPQKVFYLNQGDQFTVLLHDTTQGLQTVVHDTTTGQTGSMTASAANGFGMVKWAPNPSTECQNIPYNFHPMYSTTTPQTTVPWAAATYNVAVDTEISHFDYCSQVDASSGTCTGTEGVSANKEPADGDDYGCWPPSASSLIKIGGCEGDNLGYDGPPSLPDWPNGSPDRPTPTIFTSPLTGPTYTTNYSSVAFNTDLPAIEGGILGTCNNNNGHGCTIIPPTDDNNAPAEFYPYYTSGNALGGCAWTVGQSVPGFTSNNYGANAEYGHLLKVAYTTTGGGAVYQYEDYNGNLGTNPCPH